jgi:hypothetical protein
MKMRLGFLLVTVNTIKVTLNVLSGYLKEGSLLLVATILKAFPSILLSKPNKNKDFCCKK